jgi:hypothetical protein
MRGMKQCHDGGPPRQRGSEVRAVDIGKRSVALPVLIEGRESDFGFRVSLRAPLQSMFSGYVRQ